MVLFTFHCADVAHAAPGPRLTLRGASVVFTSDARHDPNHHEGLLGVQLPNGNIPSNGRFGLRLHGDGAADFIPAADVQTVLSEPVAFAWRVRGRADGTLQVEATYTYEETQGNRTEAVTLTSSPFPLEVAT
jgi:hypothetical protein